LIPQVSEKGNERMGMLGPPTAVEDGVADLPGSGNSLLCLARSSSSAVDLRATAALNA